MNGLTIDELLLLRDILCLGSTHQWSKDEIDGLISKLTEGLNNQGVE